MSDDHVENGGTVQSVDGSDIIYSRIGNGAPLIVCHGSFAGAEDWRAFADDMAASHSVYLYDRRGRGANERAGDDFALEAEVDDLAALVHRAGAGAAVLGHSFGGGCALRFAVRERFAGPLILYEPRHATLGAVSRGRIPELRALLAAGDRVAAAEAAMLGVVGIPDVALAQFRQSPQWERVLQTIGCFPNELRLLDSIAWRSGDLDGVVATTFLLTGETSLTPSNQESPDAALRSLFPLIRSVTISGQGHFAYAAAPTLLARIVRDCLAASVAGS